MTTSIAAPRAHRPRSIVLLIRPATAAAVLGAAMLTQAAAAAPPASLSGAKLHRIPRSDSEIRLDGALDETAWQTAWSHHLEYEVEPGENSPAVVATEVLVMHGERHLWIGFRVFDPDPSAIRAHLAERDQAWSDDWVGVVLDTFNDERRDYLLVVNPLGVQMDQIESWPGNGTVWDGIWDSAAQITDWGWTAELEIPFSSLRFQRSDGPQIWGFDAIRGYARGTFRQMGAFPRDRDNNCYLCQAIKIEGFEGVSPGRNLEIVPTLTASRTDARAAMPDGDMLDGDLDAELGATVRWGLTPNLTLSAAANPDFSQVEADARQLEVNRPFAVFYEEKRPFFMEGADFFATPFNAVYSRMVQNPSWGLKLTGKEGAHTVGAYVVDDDVTNILLPGSQGSRAATLGESSRAAVARYKLDLGNRHTFGVLATGREAGTYSNGVAGFDLDLRLSDRDRVLAQVLASTTEYPADLADELGLPRDRLDDWAATLYYGHDTRTWSTWLEYDDVGRDFRADLGFIPRIDYRRAEGGGSFLWTGDGDDWYSKLLLIAAIATMEDHDGNLLEREMAVRFNYEGPLQSHAYLRPSRTREGYAGEEFDLDSLDLHVCLHPDRHSHAWLNITSGDAIDHANVQQGRRLLVNPGFWYRFGRHLRLQLDFTAETLDVGRRRLYDVRIGQLNASWQFNARTSVRAILQHVDNELDPTVAGDGQDLHARHLFSQMLFSYTVNPQTVLFLGYSDSSMATDSFHLTRANRTVFAKIGYALVL